MLKSLRDWWPFALTVIVWAPIWGFFLSLPISAGTSGFIQWDWSAGSRSGMLFLIGCLAAGNLIASSILYPWLRRSRALKDLFAVMIIFPFLYGAVFGIVIYWTDIICGDKKIDPGFSWGDRPILLTIIVGTAYVIQYAVLGVMLSVLITAPLGILQVWTLNRMAIKKK